MSDPGRSDAPLAPRTATADRPAEGPRSGDRSLLERGLTLHRNGRLDEAERIYRLAIELQPDDREAHNLLGILLHQLNMPDLAIASIQRALEGDPQNTGFLCNLALVLCEQGKHDAGAQCLREVIRLDPTVPGVHLKLGQALQGLGESTLALQAYREAAARAPGSAETHATLGRLLHDMGKLDEARNAFAEALACNSESAEAHNDLGLVLKDQGRLEEAREALRAALEHAPAFAAAHGNLGLILQALGERGEALAHFARQLELTRGANPVDPAHHSFRVITEPKMRHDVEQFRYLAATGVEPERFNALAETYAAVSAEIDWVNADYYVHLSASQRRRIAATYNRPIHLASAPEIPGSALARGLDVAAVSRRYHRNAPGMVFIDGLLSTEALRALRRFLLQSTIWFDFEHRGGYLGAYLGDGLACPLLLQIADELRSTFSDIFGDHPLYQLWAYKYDSALEGIDVHADFAAVNVNFWITPNSANLDPARGGLVVHNVEAPLDWQFSAYNLDTAQIRRFVDERASSQWRVPYAENRAVVFNSDLFHQTDTVRFATGYENRRINITMLFGNRGD